MKKILSLLVCIGIAATWSSARGDEGMWLLTQPPRRLLKEKYAFDLSASLLERLQKAAVMVGRAGSGAFVSADGLVLTNHHVGIHYLDELTDARPDLLDKGYVASERDQELRCPDMELRVLWSTEDVSARLLAAIKPGMTLAAAATARDSVLHAIEDESWRKTGLASEVVPLYHGARYQLCRYKKYTDVRLVFAPEREASQFFDVCFFRAYENGAPAKVSHHLVWENTPAEAGDLILAAGHPGSTHRLRSAAHLEHRYGPDSFLRYKSISRLTNVLTDFVKANPDQKRHVEIDLHSLAGETFAQVNSLESQEKYLAKHRAREESLQRALAQKEPQKALPRRQALDRIDASLKEGAALFQPYFFLESAGAFNTSLFDSARFLVRFADESVKPDAKRLIGYHEAEAEDNQRMILRSRKIIKELEILKLADSLDLFVHYAGADADLAAKILDGKTPKERARSLIEETRLDQREVRRSLFEGGRKAVMESKDPLLALARLVDPRSRRIRQEMTDRVHEPCRQAYAVILAMNDADRETYPDATHTLRLSFGKVRSSDEAKRSLGARANAMTFAGFFRFLKRSSQEEALPESWRMAWNQLCEEKMSLLFASSVDVAPGNSGSAMVDRHGRVIGVAAWGSRVLAEFAYVEDESGCSGVAACAILEVLNKVYHASALVKELGGKTLAAQPKNTEGPPTISPRLPAQGPLAVKVPNPLPDPLVKPGSGVPSSPFPVQSVSGVMPPLDYLPSISPPQVRVSEPEKSLAKRHKELVPALIKALKDVEPHVRDGATTALANLGSDAVPDLINMLADKDKAMRIRAAMILGRMGSAGRSAIPALIKALKDDDADVRIAVVRALAAIVEKHGMASDSPPSP